MKKVLKRASAVIGGLIVLFALLAPQLVGLFFLPAALIGGVVGLLLKRQIDGASQNWIQYLTYIGAFLGTLIAGIAGAIIYDWSNLLGGFTMILIYATIIPVGAALFYYGIFGERPAIMNLVTASST